MFKCKLSLDRIISLHLSKSFLSNASPKREAEIYQLIFRLPVLKFVEPMLGNSDDETLSLPRMTNNDQQSRTLEQLVTDNLLSLAHIYTLLAYTSRLGCWLVPTGYARGASCCIFFFSMDLCYRDLTLSGDCIRHLYSFMDTLTSILVWIFHVMIHALISSSHFLLIYLVCVHWASTKCLHW